MTDPPPQWLRAIERVKNMFPNWARADGWGDIPRLTKKDIYACKGLKKSHSLEQMWYLGEVLEGRTKAFIGGKSTRKFLDPATRKELEASFGFRDNVTDAVIKRCARDRPADLAPAIFDVATKRLEMEIELGTFEHVPEGEEMISMVRMVALPKERPGMPMDCRFIANLRKLNALTAGENVLRAFDSSKKPYTRRKQRQSEMSIPKPIGYSSRKSRDSGSSVIDVANGYHNLRLPADDVRRISAQVGKLRLRWRVQPQGGRNSGANFQLAMDKILDIPDVRHLAPPHNCYIDDSWNAKMTLWEQLVADRFICLHLDEAGACTEPKRILMAKGSAPLLGKVRSRNGTFIQPSSLAKAIRIPAPTTYNRVLVFCGVIEYLQENFPGARLHLATIRECAKGKRRPDEKVQLSEAAEQAVQSIRRLIATGGLMINAFDTSDRRVYMQTDACKDGWAAVFFQRRVGIIHTDGAAFTRSEGRKDARLLELMAVAKAVKRNRHLLLGADVILITDSKPNTWYFRETPTVPPDVFTEKLLDKIDNHGVRIHKCKYIQGRHLKLTDWLSRNPPQVDDHAKWKPPTYAELLDLHKKNYAEFQRVMKKIETNVDYVDVLKCH